MSNYLDCLHCSEFIKKIMQIHIYLKGNIYYYRKYTLLQNNEYYKIVKCKI